MAAPCHQMMKIGQRLPVQWRAAGAGGLAAATHVEKQGCMTYAAQPTGGSAKLPGIPDTVAKPPTSPCHACAYVCSAVGVCLQRFTTMGFDKLPICMAKTQYSFSHDATLKGESGVRRSEE